MEQLDPKDIPDVISLVSELYQKRGKVEPTLEQKKSISTFFMKYMGKAIEDSQNESKLHWTVTRHKSDVAFRSKTVVVESKDNGGKVEFIVGTSYGPQYDKVSLDIFKRNTQSVILDKFSDPDDNSWVMVFNSLMFDSTRYSNFVAGLFIGVRFSGEHFVEPKELETAQVNQ